MWTKGFSCVLALALVCPAGQFVSSPEQGRSMVVNHDGIVAAPQFLAAEAGAQILRQGGNAVDAAIAANAVMGVVQPYVNGIGGDLFAVVYEAKTGKLYGLNSSGWTPQALTIEYLHAHGVSELDTNSIHTVTVPGAVAGWNALRTRFGKLPLSKTLAPAIYYARQGFPLAEKNARYWISKRVQDQPGWKDTYLPGSFKPEVGATFHNPALANSLSQIAEHGSSAFYEGALTRPMVQFLRAQGGTHTEADFNEFQPQWVDPISTTYHGWTVSELPPNGQGIAALSMLNIMEHFPLSSYGQDSAEALHIMIEAKKLAYADMIHYVGDPRFTPVPVEQMLSKSLASKRAALIDPKQAHCEVLPSEIDAQLNAQGHSTIYLSTIDKEGNIVSLIQSNYAGYGTGMVAPGLGFSFHDRGAGFELVAGKPNSLVGHKRPLHTIIPAFMQKGDVRIGFGIMGGWNQAQAHAQFVSDVVDFNMNIQAALEAPRFSKDTFGGCDVAVESRLPEAVRDTLEKRGHLLKVVEPYAFGFMGQGEAVMRDTARQVNLAGSDPRSDGAAIPEAPSF